MLNILNIIFTSIGSSVLISIIIFLSRNWFIERLKRSLQKEHTEFLDELKWSRKAQEQSLKIAEYLALALFLEESSSKDDYRKANQLSWELAMWLPEDIYTNVVYAVANSNNEVNAFSAVVKARKFILKDKAGNLDQKNIVFHYPGINKKKNQWEVRSDYTLKNKLNTVYMVIERGRV